MPLWKWQEIQALSWKTLKAKRKGDLMIEERCRVELPEALERWSDIKESL